MLFKNSGISVFWKIMAAFAVLIMVPCLLNIWTNIQRQNEVIRETNEATVASMELYLASLENDVNNIIQMLSAFLSDENIEEVRRLKNLDDNLVIYKSFNALRKRLKEFTGMNSYVEEAGIYLTNLGFVITDTSIKKYEADKEGILKEIWKKARINRALPFITVGDEIYVAITPSVFEFVDNEAYLPDFVICAKISGEKIQGFLDKLSDNNGSRAVIIGDDRGLNLPNVQKSDKRGKEPSFEEIKEDLSKYAEATGRNDKKGRTQTLYIGQRLTKYYVSSIHSNYLHSTLLVYTPGHKLFESLSRYTAWTWFFALLTILIILLFALWMRWMLHRPLNKLLKAFEQVERGNLDIAVSYSSHDEFGSLYGKFNGMFIKLKSLIKEVYEQRLLVQKAELKQLQYQINPHFLYNSLMILYNLIRMEDSQSAMDMSKHLGNYYQYITRSGTEEVPLSRELAHARDYTAIQSIRFSNRIRVEFYESVGEFSEFMVPRLIIQPLLENAFNHGLKEKVRGGLVCVRVQVEGRELVISVEDNGESMDEMKLEKLRAALEASGRGAETTGLVNVHRRLQIKFGEGSGLKVSRSTMGGLKVEIRIVVRGEADNA